MNPPGLTYRGRLRAELVTALLIAAVVLPLVIISNATAPLWLILVHAAVLVLVIPVVVSAAMHAATRVARSPAGSSLPVTIAVRVVSVIAGTAVAVPLIALISRVPIAVLVSKPLAAGIIPVGLAYVIWSVLGFYRRAELRTAALEAGRARRAWAALTAQIKPHFLFNTLSSLEQLIDLDPARAKQGVVRLSDLYRRVLAASEKTLFPVSEELSLVEDYLHIQRLRFGDRLDVRLEVPEAVRACPMPATLLLTLVENAVKHGIEPNLGGGRVTVSLQRERDRLTIRVANPAPRTSKEKTSGHGLKDAEKRLDLLFGGAARLALAETGERVVVTVEVPLAGASEAPR